ncbi:chemoreceptor glutamine deamidase CheD [Comamonas endophytica]|uniref:Probable chemoreceptor glutamine deamidase CheD n=1 Tax=Comamonas endophytica TaxID=2949090 RepID=A0ABY6GCX7_9BURK|nr:MULTISPECIES: chemoreceptor glutamine deamidase CheD [unclassified Acidovorax]MCD2512765.1 chemoreceptor glutamine deamidase CheD [Acidovorax sp. D4N7]UYG52884.1 chemoreceptor glutamine deamidase CheD [Acidovorax sp. 5MLIR]
MNDAERRRVPRIAPLGSPPAIPAAPATLEALRARPRRPGQASFFYLDPHFQCNAVKVLPGEYFVANESLAIVTVLGSCIAACLWDNRMQVGGMNHFMLPDTESSDTSGRYGSYAMELLINEMLKLGARRETMQAKIFGGGQVMHNFTTMNVGERNTDFVKKYLQTERIPLVSEDVLDIYPRKVVYFPATGKAMVKRLAHAHPDSLVAQEAQRGSAAAVARVTAGGSVDLF